MNQLARQPNASPPASLVPMTPFSEPWLNNLRRAVGSISGKAVLMGDTTITPDQHRMIEVRLSTLRQQISGRVEGRAAIGIELAKLLAAFPTQDQSDTPASLRIEAYSDAIGDAPEWAVHAARLRFVRGEVSYHNGRFAPTPPEFASEVRNVMEPLRRDLRDLELLHALGPTKREEPTPESRARVAAMAAAFIKGM